MLPFLTLEEHRVSVQGREHCIKNGNSLKFRTVPFIVGLRNYYKLLVVSESIHSEVLNQLHEAPAGGLLGEDKTLNKLREHFYWPGNQKDVKNWCRTCNDCAAYSACHNQSGDLPKLPASVLLSHSISTLHQCWMIRGSSSTFNAN